MRVSVAGVVAVVLAGWAGVGWAGPAKAPEIYAVGYFNGQAVYFDGASIRREGQTAMITSIAIQRPGTAGPRSVHRSDITFGFACDDGLGAVVAYRDYNAAGKLIDEGRLDDPAFQPIEENAVGDVLLQIACADPGDVTARRVADIEADAVEVFRRAK